MEDFVKTKFCELYRGDCYELLKNLPDKSVDLVVIDPPYLYNAYNRKSPCMLSNSDKIDTAVADMHEFFDVDVIFSELKRVQKKLNTYIFNNKDGIIKMIKELNVSEYNTDILVWNKVDAPPLCGSSYQQDLEYILKISERGATFNDMQHGGATNTNALRLAR